MVGGVPVGYPLSARERQRISAAICSRSAKSKARRKTWRLRNPQNVKDHNRRAKLKRAYGMSPQDVQDKIDLQGGGCAICGGSFLGRGPHVDHNHRTSEVRAVLCTLCNPLLGYAKDDPVVLVKAALYLVKHGQGTLGTLQKLLSSTLDFSLDQSSET